jgi:hypothetical protein
MVEDSSQQEVGLVPPAAIRGFFSLVESELVCQLRRSGVRRSASIDRLCLELEYVKIIEANSVKVERHVEIRVLRSTPGGCSGSFRTVVEGAPPKGLEPKEYSHLCSRYLTTREAM